MAQDPHTEKGEGVPRRGVLSCLPHKEGDPLVSTFSQAIFPMAPFLCPLAFVH